MAAKNMELRKEVPRNSDDVFEKIHQNFTPAYQNIAFTVNGRGSDGQMLGEVDEDGDYINGEVIWVEDSANLRVFIGCGGVVEAATLLKKVLARFETGSPD